MLRTNAETGLTRPLSGCREELMKIVFNSARALGRVLRRVGRAGRFEAVAPLAVFLAVFLVLSDGDQAFAQTAFFTPRTMLSEFFPRSQSVTFLRFDLTLEQRERLTRVLGYAPRKPSYTIYVAKTGDRVDGYAIMDDEKGQHLPISFAVMFDAKGRILRQEVMAYRERFGDEIRDPRFREQFVGKVLQDVLREGEEIIAISGATISSRAMVVGVQRALALVDELLLRQPKGTSASLPPNS